MPSLTNRVFSYDGSELWVHDDDGTAKLKSVAEIIEATLKNFDIAGAVVVHWSGDCTKPRLRQPDARPIVFNEEEKR